MLTYTLDKEKGHLTKELYKALKNDIEEGKLMRGGEAPFQEDLCQKLQCKYHYSSECI